MSRTAWGVAAAVVVVGAGAWAWFRRDENGSPKFREAKVDRGEVVATVSASGVLSAVTTVKIGSQVSGIISALHADFNSVVKEGQLLAELDPTPFRATVDQRQADLERARAELRNSELAFARAARLTEEQVLSEGEYDAASANRDAAAASVRQSRAGLEQAVANLGYTKIASPIDGIVVDRQYDVGQTVAASFQAPVIFTIARDLTKMQVVTNIDEADIGGVKAGQEATFTVDAFPDDAFSGTVSQVRLAPQTIQNVVTYPVVIDVDNAAGRLKPGMTANVQIPVDARRDVLRVPNAALRFRPDPSLLVDAESDTARAAEPRRDGSGGDSGGHGGGGRGAGDSSRGGGPGGAASGPGARRSAVVYLQAGRGKLRAVPVRTSISDGNVTAVETDALNPGDDVVVGLVTTRAMEGARGVNPMGGQRGPRM